MIEKIKIRNAILQNKMYIFKKDISDPARFESQFREIIDKDIFEWFDYDRESELYTIPSNSYHKLKKQKLTLNLGELYDPNNRKYLMLFLKEKGE